MEATERAPVPFGRAVDRGPGGRGGGRHERSDGQLSREDNQAFLALIVAHAHSRGLAIAQKNDAGHTGDRREIGFDFAIAEECGRFDECDDYTDAYGSNVIVIEYRRADFRRACSEWGDELSVVLRDLNVTAPGSGSYVFDAC